jgi:hypothetical protein
MRFSVACESGVFRVEGLGFSARMNDAAGLMPHVHVCSTGLRPASPAALCGLLQIGDLVTRVGDVLLRGAANGNARTGASSPGAQLQQADVANLLRGPVGSVLTMHVRRCVAAGAHTPASPAASGSRAARPSSGGYAGARGPEPREAGVSDIEEDLAGLEIQVCLTRVGLNNLPVTSSVTSAASPAGAVAETALQRPSCVLSLCVCWLALH